MALILREDLFDRRVYNVVTINATVRQVVEALRRFVPDLDVTLVDNRIMNQLSYEVLASDSPGWDSILAGIWREGLVKRLRCSGPQIVRGRTASMKGLCPTYSIAVQSSQGLQQFRFPQLLPTLLLQSVKRDYFG